MDDPAITEARQVKEIVDFLYWSRLPFATVERRSDGTIVTIADARYAKAVTAGGSCDGCAYRPRSHRTRRSARPSAHRPTTSMAPSAAR